MRNSHISMLGAIASATQVTRNYKVTAVLTLFTPFLLFIVFMLMNGGDGTYTPGILLFPTGLISFSIFHRLEVPFVILAVLQYPAYGLIIDLAKNKPAAALILLAFHIGLTLVTFMTTHEI